MPLDFPSTIGQPTDGSYKVIIGNKTYYWNGTSWSTSKPSSLVPPVVDGGFGGEDIDNWNEAYSWGNYKGASTVNSIKDLSSSDTTEELQYVKQYYADYSAEAELSDAVASGGGLFLWEPSTPKSKHDGGLFISPTVPYDGTRANLVDFLAGTGETDPTGTGVWVRQFEGDIQADFFGCASNKIADDQPSIQKAIDVCHSIYYKEVNGQEGKIGKYNKVQIKGECRIKKYLALSGQIILYGEKNSLSYPNQHEGFAGDYNWQNQPLIWVDKDIEVWNERVGYDDNCVIRLNADQSRIEGIVLDGEELNRGTTYASLDAKSVATGRGSGRGFFEIRVIDPDDYRYKGSLRILTKSVQAAMLGDDYYPGFQLEAVGGNMTGVGPGTSTYTSITPSNPYQWDVVDGTLPTGFAVSPSGWVTCVNPPSASETFIRLRVADADGSVSYTDLIFTIVGKYINPPKHYYFDGKELMPQATEETSYNYQMELVNDDGDPHYWWLLQGPDGLTINQTTGMITGTPVADSRGEYTIKVVLTDQTDQNNFAFNSIIDEIELNFEVVKDDYIKIYSTATEPGYVGEDFYTKYYAYGGSGDYSWSIATDREFPGRFPNDYPGYPTASSPAPGLTLNSATGELTGTLTSPGSFNFFIRVTDNQSGFYYEVLAFGNANSARDPIIRNVQMSHMLPYAVKGQPYSFQVDTNEPCTFVMRGLPTGLSIDENTGLISGTPTGARFINGISLGWGCGFSWINVRHFHSGAGVMFLGPTNVHNCNWFYINKCDIGIKTDNMYDSRLTHFYIWSNRIGLELGGGTSALTLTDGRVEYMGEHGITMDYAHENIFCNLYFDTCGHNSIFVKNVANLTMSNCVFFRSGRRLGWRGKHYNQDTFLREDKANHPNAHLNILSSRGVMMTGCNVLRGAGESPADHWYERYQKNKLDSRVYPAHSIIFEDTTECNISNNILSGCTSQSIVGYENKNSHITIENNLVVESVPYKIHDIHSKYTGKNLLENPSKDDFSSDGFNENIDVYYGNVSLLLHGDDLTDSGVGNYPITNNNVTVDTSVKKFGSGSLYFNGSNTVLYTLDPLQGQSSGGFYFAFDPYTIDMWINPTANNLDQTILDLGQTNVTSAFAIAMNSTGNLIIASDRSTSGQTVDYTSTSVIPINEWTHIAICKTGNFGGAVRVYINGVQDGSPLPTTFGEKFIIGGNSRPAIGLGGFSGSADYFNGYIEEVRVTKGVSRYGTNSSFTLPVLPYGDENYGSLPADTQIFKPQVTSRRNNFGNGSYAISLDPKTNISNATIVIRKSESDFQSELISGTKGSLKFQNPSYYWYHITKDAEPGANPGDLQTCELQAFIAKPEDNKKFNSIRGKDLIISFYARSKNKNKINVWLETYPASSDNNYGVQIEFKKEASLTPQWNKYTFNISISSFDKVLIGKDGQCASFLQFRMIDKSIDYDWEIGGIMVSTKAPYFELTPYTE